MTGKHKKKLASPPKAPKIEVDESSRDGFDYSLVQELHLGKIVEVSECYGDVKLLFEGGRELRIYHPSRYYESVYLHEDIKDYQELVGQHLHSLSIVAGMHPEVGGWYYAKMSTTEGNFYNFSFDGDEGSGWYSMELQASIYEVGNNTLVYHKDESVNIVII